MDKATALIIGILISTCVSFVLEGMLYMAIQLIRDGKDFTASIFILIFFSLLLFMYDNLKSKK